MKKWRLAVKEAEHHCRAAILPWLRVGLPVHDGFRELLLDVKSTALVYLYPFNTLEQRWTSCYDQSKSTHSYGCSNCEVACMILSFWRHWKLLSPSKLRVNLPSLWICGTSFAVRLAILWYIDNTFTSCELATTLLLWTTPPLNSPCYAYGLRAPPSRAIVVMK